MGSNEYPKSPNANNLQDVCGCHWQAGHPALIPEAASRGLANYRVVHSIQRPSLRPKTRSRTMADGTALAMLRRPVPPGYCDQTG
jgi:hypothetical protein